MTEEKVNRREGGPVAKKAKTTVKQAPQRTIEYKHDGGYMFKEPPVDESNEPMDFYGVHFLRTHSKNNDPADVQTQIWQCLFEPDVNDPQNHTDVVATCGGSSVCFVNVEDGEVILKYNRNSKNASGVENLYALTWTSVCLDDMGLKRMNILAAAGARSTVTLIHPDAGVCYQMFRTVPNKAAAIVCSLLFYPKIATWLFCGHEDGQIQLWDVGIPTMPNYETTPVHLMTIPPVARDVYNLAFSHTHDLLIGGCDGGLYAWKVDVKKIENNERLEQIEYVLPDVDGNGSVMDSICMLRDDLLAAKCALHGQIYIFSLTDTLKNKKPSKTANQYQTNVTVEMMLKLRWSDTDNYYMNMGVDTRSCILVCGDDKGTLWVYNLANYVTGKISSPITGGSPIAPVEPAALLEWPELEDTEVEKARKLRLDTYDIVVDKCAVSPFGRHIVAVTSNNIVCIWKRGKAEDQENNTDT